MTDIVATEDVQSTREHREVKGGEIWTTYFMKSPKGTQLPQFFMVENTPRRMLRTHYHDVDQFQIIVAGGGTFGKHPIAPFTVHFARAHTPYGPITAGEHGLAWLTIRARRDPEGAQFLPETREKLEGVANRTPWQISVDPEFDAADADVTLKPLPGIHDERGLAAYSLRLRPNVRLAAPDPAGTGGQFVVALRGSLMIGGQEKHALAMSHLLPSDKPLELVAGPQGVEAVVLNFPRPDIPVKKVAPPTAGSLKTWRCELCGFVYDEAAGIPEEGIAPGTRWADVPESWNCPDCLAAKSDFRMAEM